MILQADPAADYARLRDHAPVLRVTLPDGAAAWVISRYDDVRALLGDPRLSVDKRNGRGGWTGFALPPALDANLLNMDPPDHTRVRRLVSQAFTPRRVEGLRERIEAIAAGCLDRLADEHGPADLVADLVAGYAAVIPVAVIGEVLGVPPEQRDELRGWTGTMLNPPPGDNGAGARAVLAIERLMADLVRARRTAPGDDLLTAMVAARDAGDRLAEDELTSLAFLVLFAGYETSVNLIGSCVYHLLRQPGLADQVRAAPELVASAVEETLRLEPPATFAVRRFPLVDLELHGTVVAAGETVLLGIAAANRDPAVFAEPDEFRLGRVDNPHLGFGLGPHFCLGAPLARLEGQVAVEAVLRRFPGLTLASPAEPPRWRPSLRTRALAELPVTW